MRMFNGRHHWRCPGVRTHTLAQEVVHGAGALELTRRGCAGYWEAVDFYRVINDSQASPLETFVPAAQLVEAAAAARRAHGQARSHLGMNAHCGMSVLRGWPERVVLPDISSVRFADAELDRRIPGERSTGPVAEALDELKPTQGEQ